MNLGCAVLLITIGCQGICSAQGDPDPRAAFLQALGEFSVALDGTLGDEGGRLWSSLEGMERSAAQWDARLRAYEAGMARDLVSAGGPLAARMHLALAGSYLDRMRVDDALTQLAAARQAAPDLAQIYSIVGASHASVTHDARAAVEAFVRASTLDRGDLVSTYQLARHLELAGRHDEAIAARDRFHAAAAAALRQPSTSRSALAFARIGLVAERSDVDPFFPPVAYAEGYARVGRGDLSGAIAEFRRAAARDPLTAGRIAETESIARAATALRGGDAATAVTHLKTAAALAPERGEIRRLLGRAYAAADEDAPALEAFNTAIRLAPDDERARLDLAELLTKRRRLSEAAEVLRATLAAMPRSGRARYALARVYQRQGLYEDAIRELQASLAERPMLSVNGIHAAIGALASAHQDFDTAIAAYQGRVDVHPNDPDGHLDLGRVLLRTGRDDEALMEFEVAALLAPERADAHVARAQAHLRASRFADAIAAARRALASAPEHVEARYVLGTALMRAGNVNEGQRELEEYQRLQERAAAAHSRELALDGLRREAAARSADGDHAAAVALLRKALAQDPDSPESHLDLGLALLRAGAAEEAIVQLETATRANGPAEAHLHLSEAYAATGRSAESARERAAYETSKREALSRSLANR